jgi:DHA1 family bicyclomycin/chloramphenicol resistance-like MFS transporter
VAPSIWALIVLRFVQGVAGAMVLARAMVRDISSGVRLSLMASVTGYAPVIAPVIGDALQIWFG